MSSHMTLDAAATERKARLAKYKSLKRKQPSEDEQPSSTPTESTSDAKPSVTETYLSGRNYDVSTQGPKLGFESAPAADQETLEIRAKEIADNTKKAAAEEENEDRPIDLFKLQPKKPNWDLKRDLAKKMEILNVQTDNMIARMVRERIEGQKKKQKEQMKDGTASKEPGEEESEPVGLEGDELVEGIRRREREEAEEQRREEDDEDE